jgi:hypothetical protein
MKKSTQFRTSLVKPKSRKHQNPETFSDVKPWVIAASAEEERKPNDQLWKKAPSADDAYTARLQRVRFLEKYIGNDPSLKFFAEQLDACEPRNRCLSGACPECSRLFQRWFVRRSRQYIAKHIDEPGHELVAITIVPSKPIVRPGKLNNFSVSNLQRRLKFALDKNGIGDAIGGIDFSFNEDRDEKFKPHWSPHPYLITTTKNRPLLLASLKKSFKASKTVLRPVKIPTFQNISRRRSYALKMDFECRVGYDETKFIKGKIRECRNTDHQRLRAQERIELFKYLDQIGLAARVIFRGAKPIVNLSGVRIKRIK